MGSSLFVKLNGEYLDRLGLGYSDPTYSSTFGQPGGGGCEEAETTLSAPIGYRSHLLREGAHMEVLLGSYPVFSGTVDSVDRDAWAIHAKGLKMHAATCGSLDGAYQTTTIADDAIVAGYNRGMLPYWILAGSISSTTYGSVDVTDGPNYLSTILDGVASKAGKWWTVWADNIIRLESVPTVPTYHMVPKSIDLPVSYDEYSSDVVLRFFDSTTHVGATNAGSLASAKAVFPKEVFVDATQLGEISNAEAAALVAGIFAQGQALPGYEASVEVSRWKLLNDNLGPVDLRRVRAGEMVRLHGVSNDLTHEGHHDFTIGRANASPGGQTLQLDPMGLVSNGSQEDVIAKVLGAAWDEKFKG